MNSRAEAPEFDTSRPHPARVYDFLLVNDDFEKAAADLRSIVIAGRLSRHRPQALAEDRVVVGADRAHQLTSAAIAAAI